MGSTLKMNEYISEDIEKCTDQNLKDEAIAAIHRGTLEQKNKTFFACIQHNLKQEQQQHAEKRTGLYAQWYTWALKTKPFDIGSGQCKRLS